MFALPSVFFLFSFGVQRCRERIVIARCYASPLRIAALEARRVLTYSLLLFPYGREVSAFMFPSSYLHFRKSWVLFTLDDPRGSALRARSFSRITSANGSARQVFIRENRSRKRSGLVLVLLYLLRSF